MTGSFHWATGGKRPDEAFAAAKETISTPQAGCKCSQEHHKQRQEVSSGPSFPFSPTLVDPYCNSPTILGLASGFHANRHLSPSGPLKKLWTRIGSLVANRGSSVEVRHVGSHAAEADALERRAQLPEGFGQQRACRLTPWSATRQRYS